MTQFRSFILLLASTFALPWLLLVVIPSLKYQSLSPLAYDKEADGVDGYYPPAQVNHQGLLIYTREGCVQCHTQMIRPVEMGLDGWRKGWGQDQESRPGLPVRSNELRDYLGEKYALLGVNRNGPDLANYGWRAPERNEIHQMLYAPKSKHDWSNMPAMQHLYVERLAQGQLSQKALRLNGKYAPQQGYEVVPTAEAEALVDYLLSLKKEYPVPGRAASAVAASAK